MGWWDSINALELIIDGDTIGTSSGVPGEDTILSATWTAGRSDWFASLGPGNASFTVTGEPAIDPGDELILTMGTNDLFTGKVGTVTTVAEPGQPTLTTITGMDFVSQLGEARLKAETFATDTMDQQLVDVLDRASIVGYTVKLAPCLGVVQLDDWPPYTGTVLDWIDTASKYANTVVEQDSRSGDIRVCSRTALPNFDERIVFGLGPASTLIPDASSLWPMYESSGGIQDIIGGLDGTAIGTPNYSQQGAWGATGPDAIGFVKANAEDGFQMGDVYDLNAATSWTILGWARWAGPGATADVLLNKGDLAANGWDLTIMETNSQLRYRVRESSATTLQMLSGASTIPTAEWFMWAMSRRGTTTRMYLATAPDYTVTEMTFDTSVSPPNSAGQLTVGSLSGSSFWYGGRQQMLAIWDANGLTLPQLQRLVDLDLVYLTGAINPASWTQERSTVSVINQWEIGGVTTEDAASITAYGLRTWDVNTTLDLSGFAYGSDLMAIMKDPRPIVQTTIHITGHDCDEAILLVPLDLVSYNDVIWQVLEIRHEVGLDGWRLTLTLDRNQSLLTNQVPILPV